MPRRIIRRYASVNVPVFAAAAVVYGLLMLTGDPARYQSPSFRVPFLLASQQVWGAAFAAVGLLTLAVAGQVTSLLLVAVLTLWASLLVGSLATTPAVPPSAPVWSASIAVAIITSIARRGFGGFGRGTKWRSS